MAREAGQSQKANEKIHKIKSVNGRLEEIKELPNRSKIFLDYAHTPEALKTAVNALQQYEVKVASVATAFPSGNSTLDLKIKETKEAISNGANEVDMVISRGKFHKG